MVEIYRGTSVVQMVKPSEARLSMGLSGQNEFIVSFILPSAFTFELGDTVQIKGETYFLNNLPAVIKQSDHSFQYQCTFEAAYYDLTKIQFMYEGMNEFYFNGTLSDIMDIMFENVHRIYGSGHLELGYVEATEYRNLYFKNQNCMQVLYSMMDEFEMEYYFDQNELNVASTLGEDSGDTFRYGKGQGLYKITREKVESKDIITRLWAVGSERNIPYDYRPATGDTRNLLKRSGAVDLVDAVDINGYCVKTYEGGGRWKFDNVGAGTSAIRLYVDETLLTDNDPYYASIYTEQATGVFGIKWCYGSTGTSPTSGNGRCYAYGSGVYDSTYRYMEIQISAGKSAILYDAQIEHNELTAYEGGYALTGGRFTRRLMFAAPGSHYVESNVSTYGLVEATKTFDDIYPRFTGLVTSVGTALQFCCSTMDFDVNSYLISGVEATVHFNTGNCAGYEFTLDKNDGYVHTGGAVGERQFTIIQNQDQQGYVVPTDSGIRPAVGDEFVILQIEMPSSYVTAAEGELYDAAVEYIEQNDEPRVRYTIEVDPEYAKEHALSYVIGDAVTLVDSDINVNRLIRITNIDYDLTRDGAMKLTLSEDLEPTIIQRLYAEEERIDTILSMNDFNQTDMMVGYRSILEMQHLIFDGTGYFDPENIKPLSIETLMLTVGSKWYAFTLECTMDANYNGTDTGFSASAGRLIHFTIDETGPVTWTLNANVQTGLTAGQAYYIYAYCHKTNYTDATNMVLVDTAQRDVDGTTHWNFMVGVLHSSANGYRDISLSYGMTQINGGFITTGKIESIDGNTYFDLNNSTIGGAITFESGSSGYTNISDIPTSLEEINSDEYDKYEERVKVWDQTTEPTTGMQVGDLWVDDDDIVHYYTGSGWIAATVIDALEAYLTAAMGKTVYRQTTAPTSGMVEGDVWIDSDDNDKVYVYYDGSWTETNNAEALAAAALADLKVQTFYQTTEPTTGMDIGDFWVDTDGLTYMWTGSQWISLTSQDAIDALSDAADAQATADGKITAFYQDYEPTTGMDEGDIWFETLGGANRIYVYDTGAWVESPDSQIAEAINAAQDAQTTADGKAIVFYDGTEPTTGMSEGDIWIDTGNDNTAYVYSGAAWVLYTVNDALQALADAADAQATADGKVTTFVQSYTSEGYPTAEGVGDLWYNTDTGKIHRWDGVDWDLDVADVTQTIIDGGLVTTGRLVVQNDTTQQGGISGTTSSGTTDIGLWLGSTYANRATAPFRVDHGGNATMTSATLQSSGGSTQRIVIDSSNNNMTFYNSTNDAVITIDDNVIYSKPGMLVEDGIIGMTDSNSNVAAMTAATITVVRDGGTATYSILGQVTKDSSGTERAVYGYTNPSTGTGSYYAGYFTATGSTPALNVGVYAAASGATTNWAIHGNGPVKLEGITNASETSALYYNTTTKEVSYGSVSSGLTSPLTTKGDIWVYSTADTRLPIGSDGEILSADSSETTGLKWITPSGGGLSWSGTNANGVATYGSSSTVVSEDNLEFNGYDLMVGTPTSPYFSYTHEIVVGSASSTSTGWIEVVGYQISDTTVGGISWHNAAAAQTNKMIASIEVERYNDNDRGKMTIAVSADDGTMDDVWTVYNNTHQWHINGTTELVLTGASLYPNTTLGLSLGASGNRYDNIYGDDIDLSGGATLGDLAGTGSRMVVADASGTLSATTIPSGSVTSITSGAGMNFTEITTSGSIVMGTPSTLTAATTNSASGTTHTHAITGFAAISGSPTTYDLAYWDSGTTIADSGGAAFYTPASGLITVLNFYATGTAKFTALTGSADHLVKANATGEMGSGNLTGDVSTSGLTVTAANALITGKTNITALAATDEFLIYDASETGLRAINAQYIADYCQGSYITGSGTSGFLTIWNGTDSVTQTELGGDITSSGSTCTAAVALITGKTNVTSLQSTDEFLINDVSTAALGRIDLSVLTSYMQSNLSFGTGTITGSGTTSQVAYFTDTTVLSSGTLGGDITSSGLTCTLAALAITGKTAMTSGLVSTDELLVSNGGVLNRMDISVIQSYMQSNLTFGTGTITGSGTSPQLAYFTTSSNLTSGNLTGDVTSTGTSTTITSGAIDSGMCSSTFVTGFAAIGSIASADSFIIHDSGVGIREATITQLQTYMQSNLSFGTGTVTGTGSSGYIAQWSGTSSLTYASEIQVDYPSAGNVRLNTNNLRVDHLAGSSTILYTNTSGDIAKYSNVTVGGTYNLYVSGTIYATGNIYAYSDIRGKNVLGEIGPVLPKYRHLDTFIYELKSDPEAGASYGMSAQALGEVFPHAIDYDKEKDQFGIKLNALAALNTSAIKELEEENTLLWEKMAELENKLNKLLT
jgi:hypothetical protein